MKNPVPSQPVAPKEPQDERAEWITPSVTDYDIEEATLSKVSGTGLDGPAHYS